MNERQKETPRFTVIEGGRRKKDREEAARRLNCSNSYGLAKPCMRRTGRGGKSDFTGGQHHEQTEDKDRDYAA